MHSGSVVVIFGIPCYMLFLVSNLDTKQLYQEEMLTILYIRYIILFYIIVLLCKW